MTLSESQLWALVLIVPALVSGVVSSTVAFLLARLRGEAVFKSFGWFSLTLTAYGFMDGTLSWSKPDLDSSLFIGMGLADILLIGILVLGLAAFTADLINRPWGQAARILFLVPLSAALVLVPLILSTLTAWSFGGFLLIGSGFLSALFLTALVCGIRLLTHWNEVHDRIFRRILAGTGILLVAFVPLWIWNVFGRAPIYSFYVFFLIWNLGALVLASRAFFEPRSTPPADDLFSGESLSACAIRFGLSPRESEVAGLHARGYSAKDIGEKLFISPKTVRNHISNLYDKTGTGQRRELMELLRSGKG